MRRYTTPTIELTVEGVDLAGNRVWVSFRQAARKLDVEPESMAKDGNDTVLLVSLTQAQTSKLKRGKARVQVNWVGGGKRGATDIVEFEVAENLLERVIDDD